MHRVRYHADFAGPAVDVDAYRRAGFGVVPGNVFRIRDSSGTHLAGFNHRGGSLVLVSAYSMRAIDEAMRRFVALAPPGPWACELVDTSVELVVPNRPGSDLVGDLLRLQFRVDNQMGGFRHDDPRRLRVSFKAADFDEACERSRRLLPALLRSRDLPTKL